MRTKEFANGLTFSEIWNKPTGRQLFEGNIEVELEDEEYKE